MRLFIYKNKVIIRILVQTIQQKALLDFQIFYSILKLMKSQTGHYIVSAGTESHGSISKTAGLPFTLWQSGFFGSLAEI